MPTTLNLYSSYRRRYVVTVIVPSTNQEQSIQEGIHLEIYYTNWKGEREIRRIVPLACYYGSNDWHKEPQFLMDAYDIDKKACRTFAMAYIHHMTNGKVG
jgi:hypothetical protein